MEDMLLEESELVNYESICPICLEQIFSTPEVSSKNNHKCDEEDFIGVELSDNSAQNSITVQELWTCDGCNQTFHLNCIVDWKKNKKNFTCPNCRKSHILDIDIVDLNHRSDIIYINNRYTNCIKSVLFIILGLVIFIFVCFFSVITQDIYINKLYRNVTKRINDETVINVQRCIGIC